MECRKKEHKKDVLPKRFSVRSNIHCPNSIFTDKQGKSKSWSLIGSAGQFIFGACTALYKAGRR